MNEQLSRNDDAAPLPQVSFATCAQCKVWGQLFGAGYCAHCHIGHLETRIKALVAVSEIQDRNAVIEQCAAACEHQGYIGYDGHGRYYQMGAHDCAKALRALKNAAPQVPDTARTGDRPESTTPAVAAPRNPLGCVYPRCGCPGTWDCVNRSPA